MNKQQLMDDIIELIEDGLGDFKANNFDVRDIANQVYLDTGSYDLLNVDDDDLYDIFEDNRISFDDITEIDSRYEGDVYTVIYRPGQTVADTRDSQTWDEFYRRGWMKEECHQGYRDRDESYVRALGA